MSWQQSQDLLGVRDEGGRSLPQEPMAPCGGGRGDRSGDHADLTSQGEGVACSVLGTGTPAGLHYDDDTPERGDQTVSGQESVPRGAGSRGHLRDQQAGLEHLAEHRLVARRIEPVQPAGHHGESGWPGLGHGQGSPMRSGVDPVGPTGEDGQAASGQS